MAQFRLTRQAKLVKTDDFSSVFNLRLRIANKHLVFRYRANTLNRPRLGLIVSKKTAKLAVNRNYMKRVLRELFRLNQHQLPACDIIIQVQTSFSKPNFSLIKQEFALLKLKLNAKMTTEKFPNIVSSPVSDTVLR
jgi:ribonuclease P protein component